MGAPTLSDVGESGLIARILERIDTAPDVLIGVGDDAAVVASPGERLVYTTDTLVEGVDFELGYARGYDVGWKTMAANVSDLAAMGARPCHALVTVAAPGELELALFDDLLEGLLAAGERWGARLVGGDISGARQLAVTVALVGVPGARGVVARAGAEVGDVLCVTGTLGGAAGGLLALRAGCGPEHPELVARQLRPLARLDEGLALAGKARAMIDISDGLAIDLDRLLGPDLGCALDLDALPIDPALQRLPGARLLELALTGGEDLELLCALPPGRVGEAAAALAGGAGLSVIGRVTEGAKRIGDQDLGTWKEAAWEHLRSP
jgi:thiamine-monophosphate kinase